MLCLCLGRIESHLIGCHDDYYLAGWPLKLPNYEAKYEIRNVSEPEPFVLATTMTMTLMMIRGQKPQRRNPTTVKTMGRSLKS